MKHLVLLGGGHAHAQVLLMKPYIPGDWQITLISDNEYTPYSGMVPGCFSGQYQWEDCLINMRDLAERSYVRFIPGIAHVDADDNRVTVTHAGETTSIAYDLLSINSGGVPRTVEVESSCADSPTICALKPMGRLIQWLQALPPSLHIAIIGGGMAGCEIAFALKKQKHHVRIFDAAGHPVANQSAAFQKHVVDLLRDRAIEFHGNCRVARVEAPAQQATITLRDERRFQFDRAVMATDVQPPPFINQSKLTLNDDGFISVHRTLRSVSHANVFAVGDCASFQCESATGGAKTPKAGVFALRQGRILAANLLNAQIGRPLIEYPTVKKRYLSIINSADGFASADYLGRAFRGRWVLLWKHYLDMRFMKKCNEA